MSGVRWLSRRQEGVVLPLAALMIVVLMVFAAFGVDYGIFLNERRQDQSAADTGVIAGALDAGISNLAIEQAAKAFVRQNLDTTYTDAEWSALWLACADPDKGPGFVPAATTDCVSLHGTGFVRVRVPDQIVDTRFARVIGIDTMTAWAWAEAKLAPFAAVLPFGILANAAPGILCLDTAPRGQAVPPCDGPDQGNFSSLDIELYGDDQANYQICGNAMTNTRLEMNIARGVDHYMTAHPDGVTPPFTIDRCISFGVDTLPTDAGNVQNPATVGFVTGSGFFDEPLALFRQGGNPKRNIINRGNTYPLDNRPLWDYLIDNSVDMGGGGGCDKGDFVGPTYVDDEARMIACLQAWTPGNGSMFGESIYSSPRWALVPKFHATGWPSGKKDLAIMTFEVVFIHRALFNCNANACIEFYPDLNETSDLIIGGNLALDQVTAFLLPSLEPIVDEALSQGPGGSLGPFVPELWR